MEMSAPLNISVNDFRVEEPDDDDGFFLSADVVRRYYEGVSSMMFDGFIVSIIVGRGCGFSINGKRYRVERGDVLVLAPNMILEYDDVPDAGDSRKIITSMNVIMELPSPFDTDVVAAARRCPVIRPTSDEFDFVVGVYSAVEKVHSEKAGIYRREIIKSLLFAILYKVGEIYDRLRGEMPPRELLNDERISDEFFRLMGLHYRRKRTVKFYADKMALTPKYLSKVIKKATGRSVHEWVDDAIILEIRNLLKTTDMTVLQISEELEFCSPSAFVQFFRLHTGVTPFRYRHSKEW